MIVDIIYIIIKKQSVIVELKSILSKFFTFLAPLLCDNFGFIKKINRFPRNTFGFIWKLICSYGKRVFSYENPLVPTENVCFHMKIHRFQRKTYGFIWKSIGSHGTGFHRKIHRFARKMFGFIWKSMVSKGKHVFSFENP